MVQTAVHGHLWTAVFIILHAHLSLEILHFSMICVILYLRQYRTKIVHQMRSQIFCQIA